MLEIHFFRNVYRTNLLNSKCNLIILIAVSLAIAIVMRQVTRYYDPVISRMLNADGYVTTGQGLNDSNMFAYCGNNPVNLEDPSGLFWKEIGDWCIRQLQRAADFMPITIAIQGGLGRELITGRKYTTDEVNNTANNVCSAILDGLSGLACGGSLTIVGGPMISPYSNIKDPPSVAANKNFTAIQKVKIIEQNKTNNGGVVKSDISGQILVEPQKSIKGIIPSANEWQIDHIAPKSKGGSNSYSNAQVVSRFENRIKWDK